MYCLNGYVWTYIIVSSAECCADDLGDCFFLVTVMPYLSCFDKVVFVCE